MDTSETLDDDGSSSEMSGLEGGVFSGGSLPVILVSDHTPGDGVGLVVTGSVGHAAELVSQLVTNLKGETKQISLKYSPRIYVHTK